MALVGGKARTTPRQLDSRYLSTHLGAEPPDPSSHWMPPITATPASDRRRGSRTKRLCERWGVGARPIRPLPNGDCHWSSRRGGHPPHLSQNRTCAARIRLLGTAGCEPRRRPGHDLNPSHNDAAGLFSRAAPEAAGEAARDALFEDFSCVSAGAGATCLLLTLTFGHTAVVSARAGCLAT